MNGDVQLGTLTIGDKVYNGTTAITINLEDIGGTSGTQFLGITDDNLSDGDITPDGIHIATGPVSDITITEFNNGDIVMEQSTGEEFIWTGDSWKQMGVASSWALANHVHGNIANNGTISADTAIANGNKLVITDSNNLVSRSPIAFSSSTSTFLSNSGEWLTPPGSYDLPTASSSTKGGVIVGDGLTMTSDTLSANVTGVKGNSETDYRTGNINITKANIGLGNVANIDQSKAIKSITRSGTTFTYTCLDNTTGTFTQQDNDSVTGVKGNSETTYRTGQVNITKANIGLGNVTNYDQAKAIKSITRSGTTFTYTCLDNTTGTFTQQDNNTNYVSLGVPNRLAYYSATATVSRAANIESNGSYIHIYNSGDVGVTVASAGGSAPFLIGSPTGTHVVFDNNEIVAKAASTTAGPLYIGENQAGSTFYVLGKATYISNGSVNIGARTYYNNGGKAGINLHTDGTIHVAHGSAGGGLYYHWAGASATTSSIVEKSSGVLRVSNYLTVNTDSRVQNVNGQTGTFALFVNGAIGTNGDVWSGTHIVVRKNYTGTTAPSSLFSAINDGKYVGYLRTYHGSAATRGYADILLGNNIPQGTVGNQQGRIYLYTQNTATTSLYGQLGALGGTTRSYCGMGYVYGTQIWGAVWNDYAEFREVKEKVEPGRCVIETGKGDLILSTERLQDGAEVVSDTYGFAIGETKKNNTPIASSGRVLAYPYEDKEILRQNIGKPVGSGPNGTVSLMTDEEARMYPWKMIGIISEIPDYLIWHAGSSEDPNDIQVNGRIWIRIR